MRILFVDDEPNILSGLRRILRPLRDEWDMEFQESGEAALQLLETRPCDVIVSDMKMPGMDGAQLLSTIKERYPESIRIALSGETDSHMVYRCVQHAHQYLAKPCDIDLLTGTVRRAFSLRDLVEDDALKSIIAKLTSLPSLPAAYQDIMQELQSEDPSLDRVGKIIESDVAMSAKLLQIVNSAFFGLVTHVSSPADAAMYLGVDVIKSLVLTTGVFSQFESAKVDTGALTAVWNHSMRVGALANQIMRDASKDKLLADYAMMGGLLANVGKLVVAANLPDEFAKVSSQLAAGERSELEIERDIIGHDHTEIGAYLICLWGLPNPVIECVAYHHSPRECVDASITPLSTVHIATAIVDAGDNSDLVGLDSDYVEQLGQADKVPQWVQMYHDIDAGGEDGDNG